MRKIIFTVCASMIFILSGCVKGPEPTISISEDEMSLPGGGGIVTVEVSANFEYIHEISAGDDSWISCVMSGAFNLASFSIGANDTYSERSAVITFTNAEGTAKAFLTIFQSQNDAIIVADKELSFDYKAYDFIVDTESNVGYEVELSSDWISRIDEPTKALEDRRLSFHISANPSEEARETVIILKHGDVSENVLVRQGGKTNRVIMEIVHNETLLDPLSWIGNSVYGTVRWGDGTEEEYAEGVAHEFFALSGDVTTIYDMYGVQEVRIDTIGTVSSIAIEYEPLISD